MLIYRVLHMNTGFGPYREGYWADRLIKDYWNTDHRFDQPMPHDDGIPWEYVDGRNKHFGFVSIPALRSWFGYVLPYMIADGFMVVQYRAIEARMGRSGQVAFDLATAEFVKIIRPIH